MKYTKMLGILLIIVGLMLGGVPFISALSIFGLISLVAKLAAKSAGEIKCQMDDKGLFK